MEITQGTLPVDGAEIAYEIVGTRPSLVLIHGGLVHMGSWDDQLGAFAERLDILRYDQRGFARSVATKHVPFRHVDDLAALLEHLGLARVVVLGLSQGGRVALELAVTRPDLVTGVVVAGPGQRGLDLTGKSLELAQEVGQRFEAGDIEGAVETIHRLWTDGPNRSPSDVKAEPRARLVEMTLTIDSEFDVDGDEIDIEPTLVDRLEEVGVPTLLVEGSEDIPEIHAFGDVLERRIPDIERIRIPAAGHHPNVEEPEEFNRVVLEWLERRGLG